VDNVRLGNGSVREREVVEHPGAVAVLPLLPGGRVVLVRQYRHAVGRTLLEVPAGTREPGEEPEETARRELEEETGYRAGSLEFLVRFFASPGWAAEELEVYVARDPEPGASRQEADEDLSLVEVSLDGFESLIASGEIADAKTILTLLALTGRRLTPH
jgi:ADP-ribose pyrophosphatase